MKVTNSSNATAYFTVSNHILGNSFITPLQKLDINDFNDEISLELTKNPPYEKDHYDIWGMYKSDFSSLLNGINEQLGRRVTKNSQKSVDVWSLRKIKTSIGADIKITYESDYYEENATLGGDLFTLKSINRIATNEYEVEVNAVDFTNLLDHYQIGDVVDLSSIYEFDGTSFSNYELFGFDKNDWIPYPLSPVAGDGLIYPVNVSDAVVQSIESNSITIESFQLENKLYGSKQLKGRSRLYNSAPIHHPYGNYTVDFNVAPQHFYGGFLMSSRNDNYGGGIAVSEITTSYDQQETSIRYTYDKGVTSYSPFGLIDATVSSLASGSGDEQYKVDMIEQNSYFHYDKNLQKFKRNTSTRGTLWRSYSTRLCK